MARRWIEDVSSAAGGSRDGRGAGIEPALALALADGMVELTRLLSDLAFDLASDPDTLRRHMHGLQAVDRITQAQLAMADVLRSADSSEARLASITLEGLAQDLAAKLDAYRKVPVSDQN